MVILLSFLASGMILVKFLYKENEEPLRIKTDEPIAAMPTVVQIIDLVGEDSDKEATSEADQEEQNYDPDYPLWEVLPYHGKGFVVDRYIKPLTLAVKIKGLDRSIVEEGVDEWLEENGIDPFSHIIVWED